MPGTCQEPQDQGGKGSTVGLSQGSVAAARGGVGSPATLGVTAPAFTYVVPGNLYAAVSAPLWELGRLTLPVVCPLLDPMSASRKWGTRVLGGGVCQSWAGQCWRHMAAGSKAVMAAKDDVPVRWGSQVACQADCRETGTLALLDGLASWWLHRPHVFESVRAVIQPV